MSINVYLKECIRTDVRFKEGTEGSAKFDHLPLYLTEGSIFLTMPDSGEIPSAVLDYVEGVSMYEHIPAVRSHRETGIYQHQSAETEVTLQQMRNETYMLKTRAKTLADARSLNRLIKTGKIRPVESYEGSQQGISRADLECQLMALGEQLESAVQEKERLLGQITDLRGDVQILSSRVKQVQALTAQIHNKRLVWPWGSKREFAQRVDDALSAKGE